MDDQFQLLFDKLQIEMQKQNMELQTTITKNIMESMDEKLHPIIAENKILKTKLEKLEIEVESLKRAKKQNNLIFFGIKEDEKSNLELLQKVKKILKTDLSIKLEDYEVSNIYRIGKKPSDKARPTLVTFVNEWKKNEVMKMKKNLKDIYISEDYTKDVLEKRKMLQPQLMEERKKGNIAYLKFDKIIIKGNNIKNDKRKRETSTSPQCNNQPKKQQNLMPSNISRLNAYDLMRFRSNSLPSTSTDNKQ
ncbi:uncharacterized protein LOC126054324 [Helicoverpa armigera]|uniref:uncharacterized protein LOC126054324 n=1 Tax=Helicoverpa armigera TaxID=29058 RepID=UPI00211123F9|nr:uncharacterized protein LOC126054324 [Helicoverpa armigera]